MTPTIARNINKGVVGISVSLRVGPKIVEDYQGNVTSQIALIMLRVLEITHAVTIGTNARKRPLIMSIANILIPIAEALVYHRPQKTKPAYMSPCTEVALAIMTGIGVQIWMRRYSIIANIGCPIVNPYLVISSAMTM